jgi:dTDP-4-amino-4,6-dideoxygalactose transaminase
MNPISNPKIVSGVEIGRRAFAESVDFTHHSSESGGGRIEVDEFPESHALASRIMNLPVHQEIETDQVSAMIDKLREIA